ncbi:uncharacterized protein SEPMUDRAFT_147568 [Sphaerulina musiva SO2202]|uniref:Uncharacterized protein n=1 Tax=Sphaerulina musiva (strain SO2202) TaxID=692275 RepID=M3DD73_SPHMS|nr:uncharacterized protein SEPMUDRAFT_147568 [Sphaerulina musiva SO2202]EMF15774.1 hypothetical protein SEPMUDRAFT_147568 [Sphaerulina musiva SO2202]
MFPTSMDIRALVHSHGQIRREQWHGHHSSDNRQSILSIRPRSLAEHLPVLYHEQERRRCDEDILIERFVAECPEIYPRCRFNPLREEDIREVYYVTIRESSRSSSSSLAASSNSSSNTFHNDSLTHLWLQQLQRLMLLDQQQSSSSQTTSHHQHPHQTIFLHRRSNHLFRALAEVSFTNQNLRIGHVLYTFFLRHASHIVSTETSATIGQWCNAILRARMSELQRVECLRRVCEVRPDLPESLRRYGRRGRLVAEMMERAMMIVRFEMGRGEIGGGYRGRVGLGQRRSGGGLGVHFRSRSTDGVGGGGILRGGGAGFETAGLGTIGSYNNNDRRTTFLSARGLGAGRGGGVFSAAAAAAADDDGLDELRVLHDLNDLALHTAGGSSNATENLYERNHLLPETLLDDQQQHRLWELSMGSGGGGGPQYASSSRNFGINTNGMGRSMLDEMYNHNNNNHNNNIFTPMGDELENGGMGILLEGFAGGGGGGGGVSSLCLDDSSLDLYGI